VRGYRVGSHAALAFVRIASPRSGANVRRRPAPAGQSLRAAMEPWRFIDVKRRSSNHYRDVNMDKEHVKGAAQKAKGAVKDAAGALTDDEKLQAEGKADKAKGAARQSAGDIKDAGRKVVDSLKR
jgi:uncharacterized protein YjbJ (UPF0337 family)